MLEKHQKDVLYEFHRLFELQSVKSADIKLNFWPSWDLRTHVVTSTFGFLMTIFFGYIQINVQENKVIN